MSHQCGKLDNLIGTNPKCRDSYVFIEDEKDKGPYHFLKDSEIMPIVDKDLQKKFYQEKIDQKLNDDKDLLNWI